MVFTLDIYFLLYFPDLMNWTKLIWFGTLTCLLGICVMALSHGNWFHLNVDMFHRNLYPKWLRRKGGEMYHLGAGRGFEALLYGACRHTVESMRHGTQNLQAALWPLGLLVFFTSGCYRVRGLGVKLCVGKAFAAVTVTTLCRGPLKVTQATFKSRVDR